MEILKVPILELAERFPPEHSTPIWPEIVPVFYRGNGSVYKAKVNGDFYDLPVPPELSIAEIGVKWDPVPHFSGPGLNAIFIREMS